MEGRSICTYRELCLSMRANASPRRSTSTRHEIQRRSTSTRRAMQRSSACHHHHRSKRECLADSPIRLSQSPNPRPLIRADVPGERVVRRDSQVRQRDDVGFLGLARRRHIAHDAAFIAQVEYSLDEQRPIWGYLQRLRSQCTGKLAGRAGWDRQLRFHLAHQINNCGGIVYHRHIFSIKPISLYFRPCFARIELRYPCQSDGRPAARKASRVRRSQSTARS
jgi:hypothetical protein